MWYPPSPMAETCTPVRPSGFLGTSPAGTCCDGSDCCAMLPPRISGTAPSTAAPLMKLRRLISGFDATVFSWTLRFLEFSFGKGMPCVHRGSQHVPDLRLLRIEGESVGQTGFRVIELQRQLIKLEAAICRILLAAIPQLLHLRFRHRREILRDLQILGEHIQAVDAGDGSGDSRQAYGIPQGLLCGNDAVLDGGSMAAEGLHAQNGDAAFDQLRQHLFFKAAEVRIERVKGHLHGVEGKAGVQHGQMDFRILMTGKSNEPDLAIFLCLL